MIMHTLEVFPTLSLKKLKIGLDARSLANTQKSGVEGYVADLVENLPTVGPDIDWYFFTDRRGSAIKSPHSNLRYVHIPFTAESRFWKTVAGYCRLKRFDLFHFPIALIPERFPVPAVITIYDLASEVYPQFYSERELKIHRNIVKRSVTKQAAGILAISQATRNDLIKLYKADPDKIHVTYLSPHIEDFGQKKTSPYDFPYMLAVGNIQPRKNFPNAVMALAKQPNHSLHLVIAGKYQEEAELKKLEKIIEETGTQDRVHVTGYMPQADLNNHYAHAEMLLYPSYYEGFGIPLLEAFFYGLPVVTANTSSMPEIAGDAAVYCNPDSPNSIARAIDVALKPANAKALAAKGSQRLQELSRVPLAQSTLKAYKKIINEIK